MSRPAAGRPLRTAVLVLVVAALAATGTVAAVRHEDGRDRPRFPAGTSQAPWARVVPPSAAAPGPVAPSAGSRRTTALTALLANRAAAVLSRDRARFLAGVDGSPTFRRAQLRLFDALTAVRFSSWRYDMDAPERGRPVPSSSRFRGAAETYAPRSVVALYQLAGYDAAPTSTQAGLTFVRRGTRWLLAADADFDRTSGRTQREIWDYGPLTSVSGPRTLVIGARASRRLLGRLRSEAERDIPRVSAVVGRSWSQRVVIVVPASQRQLAAIVHKPYGSLSRIAAVATAELGGTGAAAAVGNRILINPGNVDRLDALGRRVVITHEITHVATRGQIGAGTPTWLVEGFADYVAYRGVPVRTAAAARELTALVRAGRVPTALPTDADFTGTNPQLASAYEGAWLAVRMIADRAGGPGLLQFYRAAGRPPAGKRALETALVTELRLTPAQFLAGWRGYLKQTLS